MWGYQEDVVRFTRFDERLVPPSYKGQSLVGRELPVVEFRKWIYGWTSRGRGADDVRVPGTGPCTDNIVTDPVWRTTGETGRCG